MFFISWGTKVFQQREGVAADFCPICRRASTVEVRQIRSQPHVYGIGMGQGKVVGRLIHCLTCESDWALQAGTIQTSVNPTVSVSLETLLAETYPRFAIVNGERLEQEAAIQRDPFSLDQQTRLSLIAEPFFVLDNDVQRDENKTSWQRILAGVAIIAAIAFLIAAIVSFFSSEVLWGVGWLVVMVGLVWASLRLSGVATDKFMRRSVYPRLASCLAPLRPTSEELAAIIGHIESKSAQQTRLQNFLPFLEEASSRDEAARATVRR